MIAQSLGECLKELNPAMPLSLGNIDSCFSVHHRPESLDSTERSVTVAPWGATAERNKRASLYHAVRLSMSYV